MHRLQIAVNMFFGSSAIYNYIELQHDIHVDIVFKQRIVGK